MGITELNKMIYSPCKKLVLLLCLIFVSALPGAVSAANGYSDIASRVQRDTNQLVQSVQGSLQMQGKWPPHAASAEMQLCSGLNILQQQVNQLVRSGGNASQSQQAAMQLQGSIATLEPLIAATAATNPAVGMQWSSIKMGISSLMGGAYSYPMYNPSPWTSQPGMVPAANNSRMMKQLERDTDNFVNQATAYFRMTGRLTSMPVGNDAVFASSLQNFQRQVRNLSRNSSDNEPYYSVQAKLQQLTVAASAVDQSIQAAGMPPNVMASWMQVKNNMTMLGQPAYPPAGNYGYPGWGGNSGWRQFPY